MLLQIYDGGLPDCLAESAKYVAREAFTGPGPDEEDVEAHVQDVAKVAMAYEERTNPIRFEPVGFASKERIAGERIDGGVLLQHGLAVHPDHQEKGLGTILLDRLTAEALDGPRKMAGGRSQAPFYLNYVDRKGGVPPPIDCAPEYRITAEEIADFYGQDLGDDMVIEEAYDQPLFNRPTLDRFHEMATDMGVEGELGPRDAIVSIMEVDVDEFCQAVEQEAETMYDEIYVESQG